MANAAAAEMVPEARDVPQSEPLDDRQVLNDAGGFVYEIDDMQRLRRLIILGNTASTYDVARDDLTVADAACVLRLLADGRGADVVREVVTISTEGRAPKQSAGVFVLAMVARLGDMPSRRAALVALPAVCRTASTLFEFVQRCKELGAVAGQAPGDDPQRLAAAQPDEVLHRAEVAAAAKAAAGAARSCGGGRGRGRGRGRGVGRGPRRVQLSPAAADGEGVVEAVKAAAAAACGKASWGRGMRRAVADWYLGRTPAALAYQVTKYSQRGGWSHADLLRLAHPDPQAHVDRRQRQQEALAKAAAAAKAEKKDGEASDADWEMVSLPAAADAGEEGEAGEGAATKGASGSGSELGALEAAMAAVALGAGEGEGDRKAAARAQWVADMKAIFAFLTHGTLPEQAQQQQEAGAVGAEGEGAAAAATAGDGSLSPVLQYLCDAHRLRKVIRAPGPPRAPKRKARRQVAGADSDSDSDAGGSSDSGAEQQRRQQRKRQEAEAEAVEEAAEDPAAAAERAAGLAAAVESAVALVRRHRFGHEHVGDNTLLRCPELWAAFLEVGMPLTALVRNLGRMTAIGVMDRADCLRAVTERLRDPAAIARSRLHPLPLLEALVTYRKGAGARGVARWEARGEVCEALEAAFYAAFKNVVPCGKRFLCGLDVSGSMGWTQCSGMASLTAREAAAAVLMSLVRSEPWVKTLAFSHELVPFKVSPGDSLEEVVARSGAIPMGGTDCALPMLHALGKRLAVDVFVVLTDNETWYGDVHPTEALKRYRREMAMPDAKLVVLAFSGTSRSIADPADPGMLDVAGLDSAVPRLVADFVAGRV